MKKKFKYAPNPIPPLTVQQWDFLNKEMRKPPTKKQLETYRRASEVYKAIKPHSQSVVNKKSGNGEP